MYTIAVYLYTVIYYCMCAFILGQRGKTFKTNHNSGWPYFVHQTIGLFSTSNFHNMRRRLKKKGHSDRLQRR